jgi:hypothetical protein
VDDDVLLSEGLLRCMTIQLLAHNTSIFGLDARSVEPGTGNYMSRPLALDTPVIIIGKTMLMHERAPSSGGDTGRTSESRAPKRSLRELRRLGDERRRNRGFGGGTCAVAA